MNKALPYIIQITNTSMPASTVNDIVIFDAANKLRNIANTNAWGNNAFISITSGTAGVTYEEILWTAMNRPFTVGLTYLTGTAQADILTTISNTTLSADGTDQTFPLIPTIDPYQNQSAMTTFNNKIRIDGFTKLTIASLAGGNHSLLLYMYPLEDADIARSLWGENLIQRRANPEVVKMQRFQMALKGF